MHYLYFCVHPGKQDVIALSSLVQSKLSPMQHNHLPKSNALNKNKVRHIEKKLKMIRYH